MSYVHPKLDYTVPQNQAGLLSPDYLASSWCVWRINPFSYWTVMQLAKMGVFSYLAVDDRELQVGQTQYGTLYSDYRNANRFELLSEVIKSWSVKGKGLLYEEDISTDPLNPSVSLEAEFHLLTIPDTELHRDAIIYLRNLYSYPDNLPYEGVGGWIIDVFPISKSVSYVLLFNRHAATRDNWWMWEALKTIMESREEISGSSWPKFPTRFDLPIATASLITSRFINHFMRQGDLPEADRNLRNIPSTAMGRIDPLPTKKDEWIELWRIDTKNNQIKKSLITKDKLRLPDELLQLPLRDPTMNQSNFDTLLRTHVKFHEWKATFFGAGHLGSWIARMFGILGIPKITLIDYDTVEHRNIAGAAFRHADQGELKIEKIKYGLEDMLNQGMQFNAGTIMGQQPVVRLMKKKITKRTQTRTLAPMKDSNLFIVSTDSWNSRHDFTLLVRRLMKAEKIGDPCWIIDCRSLERLGQIIIVNVRNRKAFNAYTKPLEASSVDHTPLPCDRANVIDLPVHLSRFVVSLLWNQQQYGNSLPPADQETIDEYYINPYGYSLVKMT